MELNIQQLAGDCLKKINETVKNLKRLNIIVAGKTGVGKSTLINYMFREQLAETGIGKPVTQHMRRITKKDVPLTIYDTKGLELGRDTQKQIKKEILDTIKAGMRSADASERIHCIWYCVNTASDRIEDDEVEWIKELSADSKGTDVPIIIVLTKSFSKKKAEEMRSYIEGLNLDVCAIVPVLALEYEIDDDLKIPAYGGDKLIEVMGELLGDELVLTLSNVQHVALEQKVKTAQGIVAATVTASFAEGFTPVPFSDSVLLVPTQITMIASITAVFGLKVDSAILTSFITSIIGTTGATIIGRTVSSNLLKLIPGAGTLIGGAISGGTAALVTTALGQSYIELMKLIYTGELSKDELKNGALFDRLKQDFRKRLGGKTDKQP